MARSTSSFSSSESVVIIDIFTENDGDTIVFVIVVVVAVVVVAILLLVVVVVGIIMQDFGFFIIESRSYYGRCLFMIIYDTCVWWDPRILIHKQNRSFCSIG